MARLTKKKKLAAIGATAAIALGSTGVAYAYFTSNGSGTGSATTGSATPFDVVVGQTTLGTLTPNGPAEKVSFSITNGGSGTQYITTVDPSVTGTSADACGAGNFTVSNLKIATGSINAGSTRNGSFELRLIDTGSNQNSCVGVTVDLKVAVS